MAVPRVVVVRSHVVWTAAGALDPAVLAGMFARGFAVLTDERVAGRAAAALFRPGERVGIKVNTIGGKAISTRPEVARALAAWMAGGGIAARDIVIWDRTTRELLPLGQVRGSHASHCSGRCGQPPAPRASPAARARTTFARQEPLESPRPLFELVPEWVGR